MFKILGKNPNGQHKLQVQSSSLYSGGAFQNILPTTMLAPNASYSKMMRQFFTPQPGKEPKGLITSHKNDLHSLTGDSIHLTWFGHSSYHFNIKGKSVLVDPVFSGAASPVRFAVKAFPGTHVFRAEDVPAIDLLILTHDHYDHLDFKTLIELRPKVKQVVCSLGLRSHLEFWGYSGEFITELEWWQSIEIDSFRITGAPARHFSGRLFKRAQTLWSSFVLQYGHHKIFIGGDSGYGDHFKEIGKKFNGFDLAILECGQYDEKWPMIHMTPEQTVQAGLDLNSSTLFPVHWGKFALANHHWKEPIERFTSEAERIGVAYVTPVIGKSFRPFEERPTDPWWRDLE